MRPPGKRIGTRLYIHQSCEDILPISAFSWARTLFLSSLDPAILYIAGIGCPHYDVVCYDKQTGSFTFTKCRDFNNEKEPVIVSQTIVLATGNVHIIPQPSDPRIYHHKWLFVRDHYAGFDVEAAKRRSEWYSKHITKTARMRIGSLRYWNRLQEGFTPT